MSNLLKVKNDLKFYGGLITLTKAVKAVAILQFRILEKSVESYEKFLEIIKNFFELIDIRNAEHPFINPQGLPSGAIAVTSETGLLGGLNNRIMFAAINYLKNPQDKLVVVGYQGQNFARTNHIPCKGFPSIKDEERYSQASALRDYVVEEVLNRRMGAVKIVYPHPISIVAHRIVSMDILPCVEWCKDVAGRSLTDDIIFESSPGRIVEYLSYMWIGQKIHEVFGYSRLAELSARITHMEGCTQKVEELEKQLKIKYHKERHQNIDQQMRELFSARALYAK